MRFMQKLTSMVERHPRVTDTALVVAVLSLSVCWTLWAQPEGSERESDVWAVLLAVAAPVSLWWRRSAPLAVLSACTLFTLTYWVADYSGGIDAALWIAFYAATRHGGDDRRQVWRFVLGALGAVVGVATIGVISPTEDLPAAAVVGLFVIHATAASFGEAMYQRSQKVLHLEQRALALEADVANQKKLAALDERTRIAREMHDIIAHGMSSIVVQASAGQRVIDNDPAAARHVLETIETIGRDSVDEMRRMLGVLRDSEGEPILQPQPSFDDFRELGHRAIEAGVDTSIEVYGTPTGTPPGVELTGYRVIQESLTNVIRHAGRPVRADVEVVFTDGAVEIEVSDDGLGAAANSATAGSGHGLMGMRERVELYKGSFEAGPRPGGGYLVRARLPFEPVAMGESAASPAATAPTHPNAMPSER